MVASPLIRALFILTQPVDPEKKSLNFIFPTKYVIPKSLKFSHWPSKYWAGGVALRGPPLDCHENWIESKLFWAQKFPNKKDLVGMKPPDPS